ncbi:hypothetical protein A0H81_13026 [Grifola frondosa]|uniref:C2H2-type domain-containing protein n=1 Tax=Grifola frondosa TaxID=5627 RepID=A0A1C7LRI2_GRIFR|nr:hypothetical protein A0H81_13026 [Grifola frondosa]
MDASSNNLQTVEHDFSQPSSSTKIEPVPPMIELTKDGNVSKMRLHKGNVPSLPQTKLCPICPAKFTRTTHLNRHLRTHTNERLHECDFTRSDLLTRHKRSCGDSSSVNRSRPATVGWIYSRPTVESTDIIIDRLESTSIGSSPEPTFPFPTDPVEVPHGSLPLDFQRPEAYAPSANSPTATGPSETGWPVAPSAPPAPSPQCFIITFAFSSAQRLPPILLSAMRACGALYVRTQTAIHFIDSTLASARDELIAEFAKTPTDYEHLVHLTLTISLLQTIGLFHRSPEQRAASNVYHGMIVMMIRMSGFIERTVNWEVPNVNVMEPLSVESAWREWIIHETGKRALWICYLHDCCHTIYFNLRATFLTKEFNLGLPCEDGLWAARSIGSAEPISSHCTPDSLR